MLRARERARSSKSALFQNIIKLESSACRCHRWGMSTIWRNVQVFVVIPVRPKVMRFSELIVLRAYGRTFRSLRVAQVLFRGAQLRCAEKLWFLETLWMKNYISLQIGMIDCKKLDSKGPLFRLLLSCFVVRLWEPASRRRTRSAVAPAMARAWPPPPPTATVAWGWAEAVTTAVGGREDGGRGRRLRPRPSISSYHGARALANHFTVQPVCLVSLLRPLAIYIVKEVHCVLLRSNTVSS